MGNLIKYKTNIMVPAMALNNIKPEPVVVIAMNKTDAREYIRSAFRKIAQSSSLPEEVEKVVSGATLTVVPFVKTIK